MKLQYKHWYTCRGNDIPQQWQGEQNEDVILSFLLKMKTDNNKILIPLSHMLQIVPFLALGLGVDDMFLLTHTYAEQEHGQAESHSHYQPDVSLTQPWNNRAIVCMFKSEIAQIVSAFLDLHRNRRVLCLRGLDSAFLSLHWATCLHSLLLQSSPFQHCESSRYK